MAEKKYWKGLADRNNDPDLIKKTQNEFQEDLPLVDDLANEELGGAQAGRRDFLKMMGFSVTAAAVAAACEIPVRKSIPYLVKPEEVTPGVANFYASTYVAGGDYVPVLVKTREGRPIKIEGNNLSTITNGGTSATAQASVLNLYDNRRLKHPTVDGEKKSWSEVDKSISQQLGSIQEKGGNIRILTGTILSPSVKQAIADFTTKYPNARHVMYDTVSYSGLLNAAEKISGKRALPSFRFDKADVIVGVGADFLGTWLSPVEYTSQYGKNRKIDKKHPHMSRHIQVESYLSLTGSNADKRIRVKPSQEAHFLGAVYNALAGKTGDATVSVTLNGELKAAAKSVADELWAAKGKSLVVAGSNSTGAQQLALAINYLLNNFGTTVDFNRPSHQRAGDDAAVSQLVKEMNNGSVDALMVWDVNAAYTLGESFTKGLDKVGLTISLNEKMDETTVQCKYVCPSHNYLEAWNDYEPQAGRYSLGQPTIDPLFDTRHAGESLLAWAGSKTDMYDYIRNHWKKHIYPKQNKYASFNVFWDRSVHDGVVEIEVPVAEEAPAYTVNVAGVKLPKDGGTEVVLIESVGLRDGRDAHNPWLQELPDPVTKTTWDNFALVSQTFAEENGLETALLQATGEKYNIDTEQIKISVNGKDITLPVIVQPGIAENTIAIALGYGRDTTIGFKTNSLNVYEEDAAKIVGKNAFPLVTSFDGTASYVAGGATIERVPGKYPVAQTQTHHMVGDVLKVNNGTLEKEAMRERRIIKETTLEEYKKNPYAGNEDRAKLKEHLVSLYPEHNFGAGHHWEMAVDLNSCTGCGACVVACHAENNVPVVGKNEVRNAREMHWLRIDRYYTGDQDNPSVVFQAMMCQHCDNAPCENVCPVSATNHSTEGLNQMAYNRCIGTRYCANNCPYKVRRFNWFDYLGADSFKRGTVLNNDVDPYGMSEDLTRMVLNPDVTVRSRGVMEKCSFCVQRIQEGKLKAKKEGRPVEDGEIKTACQAACTTGAITFGDNNDENSKVRELYEDERAFKVIEEVGTAPSVSYLTKVRNRKGEEA